MSTTTTATSAEQFLTAVRHRRSIYGISKEKVIPNSRVKQIVEEAVKYSPSAFNSQSARVLVLFDQHSDKLWQLTTEILRAKTGGGDSFKATEDRMKGFSAGYGTVLFFEDQTVVEELKNKFPSYAAAFEPYSYQSSGMLQYIVWTALEQEGLGASLQHYQPLIDETVQKEFNIPSTWKLLAQMPFGKQAVQPNEKQFQPLDERVKVFE